MKRNIQEIFKIITKFCLDSFPFPSFSRRDFTGYSHLFLVFPARSFGIELEYNGGVLRFLPEICLRFSGSAHFSKRGKAEKTEDFTRPNTEQKKTSCSTRKCYTRSHFLGFLGSSQAAESCLLRAVRGYLSFPITMVSIPTLLQAFYHPYFWAFSCIFHITII